MPVSRIPQELNLCVGLRRRRPSTWNFGDCSLDLMSSLPPPEMIVSRFPALFRLFSHPTRLLPHATVSTFAALPIPISLAFAPRGKWTSAFTPPNSSPAQLDIRGVVLDKDNCFARDGQEKVWKEYEVCCQLLF